MYLQRYAWSLSETEQEQGPPCAVHFRSEYVVHSTQRKYPHSVCHIHRSMAGVAPLLQGRNSISSYCRSALLWVLMTLLSIYM